MNYERMMYWRKRTFKPEAIEVILRLQKLQENNMPNHEIEHVIKELNLPFSLHMFIMGNFSELMELKFDEV